MLLEATRESALDPAPSTRVGLDPDLWTCAAPSTGGGGPAWNTGCRIPPPPKAAAFGFGDKGSTFPSERSRGLATRAWFSKNAAFGVAALGVSAAKLFGDPDDAAVGDGDESKPRSTREGRRT